MTLIARSSIEISERQRSDITPRSVADLKDSISRVGLLNRPVVEPLDSSFTKFRLIAGETRLRAIDAIAGEGSSFIAGSEIVEPGMVPVTITKELSALTRTEAEFDENFVRTQPDWKDRQRALLSIHKLREAQNPLQTIVSTAKELAAKNVVNARGTVGNTDAFRQELQASILVEKHLTDPVISKARSLWEANQLVLKKESDQAQAELIRRRREHSTKHSTVRIEQGDLFIKMKELRPGIVDLILSDPPYGINAHTFHKGDRTGGADSAGAAAGTNLHAYKDTPEEARKIYLELLREGFRVSKPMANICLFIGFRHFQWLLDQSKALGWVPWEEPIPWIKSETEGIITGWGRHGFIKTKDWIFFATKGQRGLNNAHVDSFRCNRVPRNRRIYSAEKPVALMRELIELCTLPGDLVLDPCAGSGSTLVAARDSKRSALGFEIIHDVVDLAEVRLNHTEDDFDKMGDGDGPILGD